MDNDELLCQLFDVIAKKHLQRGVNDGHLIVRCTHCPVDTRPYNVQNMRPAVLDTLKCCLDNYTPATAAAWSAFLLIIASNIENHKTTE